jgi:hypothetical protein
MKSVFSGSEITVSLGVGEGDSVVLIKWEYLPRASRPRNVFRVNEKGEVVWQVSDYGAIPGLSTFTNIFFNEQGALVGYNFDGGEYEIDPLTGEVGDSRLVK